MVESIGASPVTATIANFGSMFNNGAVDVIAAPAVAFRPLELYKGIGTKGGVVNFALVQLTVQVLTRHAKFPADFGQKIAWLYFTLANSTRTWRKSQEHASDRQQALD